MTHPPSLTTRLLHAGLAIGISLQLLISTFMQMPGREHPRAWWQTLGFTLHEGIGLLMLPLIAGWFVWLFVRRHEEGPQALFPWFTQAARHALIDAVRGAFLSLKKREIPLSSETDRIARAVHGLGALCALGMALSGLLVWLGLSSQGELADWARLVLDLHQALATLMWIYVLSHAAMALLHHRRGETTLKQMFSLGPGQGILAGKE
ncbi:MAG: cytochrome b/b6 domain-containing protein [Candidatus Thiodiazotropha sp.]